MCLNETYSTLTTDKNPSDKFPTQNSLKQGDALSPMLFNSALQYAIRKVQENQEGLKNGTHKLWPYADDINIVGETTDAIKKNTVALLDASQDVSLELNAQKTKYLLTSHYHKAGQKHSIMTENRCFENVAKFKYLGTSEDQNCMHAGNASFHSVQSLFIFLPAV
jgi:hypothetical protein